MNSLKIKQIFFRIKGLALSFILTTFVSLINLVKNKNTNRPGFFYGHYILGLGIIPRSDQNLFALDSAWNKTYSMFTKGDYSNCTRIRKEIMHEIYELNGLLDVNYFPPILSELFSTAFGHQLSIGVHIGAQNLGLIPSGQRYLVVQKNHLKRPFFSHIDENIKVLSSVHLQGSGEPPGVWHIYERLQIIKAFDYFIEGHELIEKVFVQSEIKSKEPILKLNYDYSQKAISELKNYGLNESDWFVTLHVRETKNSKEHNSQSISNYIKSIHHIINLGGKVIRIGDRGMPCLPEIPGLIDLSQNSNISSHLHIYALAAAKFFIGTPSGPRNIPSLFGVPGLMTNTTQLAITTFRCSRETLYIPKKVYVDKNILSFFRIMNSSVGYGGFDPFYMKEKKIFFESNSEDEILDGVKEMINIVFNRVHPRDSALDYKVKQIREQVDFATTGLFSAQWMEKNQTWFLSGT
jgi:putative glycosyltransferase (TIGR04372 family)